MKRKVVWLGALVVLSTTGVWAVTLRGNNGGEQFIFATIERGVVEEVVTSTGTLEATETVEVGTQVSGQIAEIFVDFNDHVKEGQLLARIDPALLQTEVRNAEANLARARAELEHAERVLERNRPLYQEQVITAVEFENIQYQHSLATASYTAAEVSLDRARRNLRYTEIHAPITGRVIQRSVDVGQTVSATMSAPTLFVIAKDLTQMQIFATVFEGDIGRVHEGQEVRFTVQAFSQREYAGTVQQVRLESTTTDNVVSYGVVIDVDNPGGELLPGMTATVQFVLTRAEDVLKVPNSALRFRPPGGGAAQNVGMRVGPGGGSGNAAAGAGPGPQADGGTRGGGGMVTRGPSAEGDASGEGGMAMHGPPGGGPATSSDDDEGSAEGAARPPSAGQIVRVRTIWRMGADGELEPLRVRTGANDGRYTEVTGPGIEEGMSVVIGSTSGSSAAAPSASPNPFRGSGPSGPPGGVIIRGPGPM